MQSNHNQFHGKDIKIFAANATQDMAKQIAECLGLDLGKSNVTCFSDGEISVSVLESVRGSDCFIVQSTCAPVNDNLMELLLMTDAFSVPVPLVSPLLFHTSATRVRTERQRQEIRSPQSWLLT